MNDDSSSPPGLTPQERSDAFDFLVSLAKIALGALSVSLVAFLRHDFGERYYTIANFVLGIVILYVITSFGFIGSLATGSDFASTWSMTVLWGGYFIVSAAHFWKIWLNIQIGQPRYSYYDGTPWLLFLGRLLSSSNNSVFRPLVTLLGRITLSEENFRYFQISLAEFPPLNDPEKLTKLVIEPVIGLAFAFFTTGVLSLWFGISTVALFFYSFLLYQQARHRDLDMIDNIILASEQKEDLAARNRIKSEASKALSKIKTRVDEEPRFAVGLSRDNPDVLTALSELDIELTSSSSSKLSS